MQRIASLTLAGVILLTTVSGCAWLGLGKKDKAADPYDPSGGAPVTDPYYSAQPMPMDSGYASTGAGGSRYHTVQKKETLYSISRQYYGDQSKWKDIYAANKTEIGDPNKIRVGQRLVIP